MARPLMSPVLPVRPGRVLHACCYSIRLAFRAPAGLERKILVLGWLPAMLVIMLVAYVPFGIYNSGSAIRYASCFLLFLVFPSMLRLRGVRGRTGRRADEARIRRARDRGKSPARRSSKRRWELR